MDKQTTIDTVTGPAAIGLGSASAWFQHIAEFSNLALTVGNLVLVWGGVVLVFLRIIKAWRDHKAHPTEKKNSPK